MNIQEKHMKACLDLARLGRRTSPRPKVGCVVVNEKGKVVSTGHFNPKTGKHAERAALEKLKDAKGCTLYVNLEPCCHHGKTLPCTDIIIEKGVKKVVIGMLDPNPIVKGKGVEILREAGIKVSGPVLEKECQAINETYIKNHIKKDPFFAIKFATTIDGKIATKNGSSQWITTANARIKAKVVRKIYDAVLTSSNTVIADNPTMEHNIKIILDRHLKTDINSNIYKQGEIYVFHARTMKVPDELAKQAKKINKNIKFIPCPSYGNKLGIEYIKNTIFDLGIMSVLVEAGGTLNASFLPYADRLYQFMAPKVLGEKDAKSSFDGNFMRDSIDDCIPFKVEKIEKYGSDLLIYHKRRYEKKDLLYRYTVPSPLPI